MVMQIDEATRAAYGELLTGIQVRRGLFIIRLADVDLGNEFHRDLVYTLGHCEPGAQDGDLITAMRFTIDHAMYNAGRLASKFKLDAERMLTVDTGTAMREGKLSRAAAERTVKESLVYWTLRQGAEEKAQERTYYRELLESLQAALDNHRTTRADQRQADAFHGQTAT